MKNKILIIGILLDICLAIFTCFIYTSCITPDVPVTTSYSTHIVYGYHNYGYGYHRRHLPPPPRRPVYVCPPLRDPYHPIWVQRPSYKPRNNGFGNMQKDVRVPDRIDRVDSRPIYPRNKNFGGRR